MYNNYTYSISTKFNFALKCPTNKSVTTSEASITQSNISQIFTDTLQFSTIFYLARHQDKVVLTKEQSSDYVLMYRYTSTMLQ